MTRMKSILVTLLLYCALGYTVSEAAETGWEAVGIRVGVDFTDAHAKDCANFTLYEFAAGYRLPLSWRISKGLELRTRIDTSAGVLTREGDLGLLASLGPGLALEMFSGRVELAAGGSAAFISRHSYPRRDLGGPFLFDIHAGFDAYLYGGFGIGYQYQHLSNAYLYDHNPGLNLHMLELKYRF
jgi:lipid A 3-O-deacylase